VAEFSTPMSECGWVSEAFTAHSAHHYESVGGCLEAEFSTPLSECGWVSDASPR